MSISQILTCFAFLFIINTTEVVRSGQIPPIGDGNTTCYQIELNIFAASYSYCQSLDVLNTSICDIAAPILQPLILEPCNSTIVEKKKRVVNECYWTYFSKLLGGQKVCVGSKLSTGVQKGDLQYRLGLALKNKCSVDGQQQCVGDYGYLTCNKGKWTASASCWQGFSCVTSNQIDKTTNKSVQKASCVKTG